MSASKDHTLWGRLKGFLKANFIAGILFLTPLLATFFFLKLSIKWMDNILLVIPPRFRPGELLGFSIPGLGVLILFLLILGTGFLVRNYVGRKVVGLWDRLISTIPLVNRFYSSVKQLAETVAHGSTKDFKRVVLVQFPKNGVYSLGYVTGVSAGEVQEKTRKKCLNIYVPTTPNPTSGYYLIVPEEEVIPLDMSVEDSFKLLISGGIISPEEKMAVPPVPPEARPN